MRLYNIVLKLSVPKYNSLTDYKRGFPPRCKSHLLHAASLCTGMSLGKVAPGLRFTELRCSTRREHSWPSQCRSL